MSYSNVKYNEDEVKGRGNDEEEKRRRDGQMWDEEGAKKKDEGNPRREGEGDGG